MTPQLRLAGPGDLQQLEPLVAAYHAFETIDSRREDRLASLQTLLADRELGGIWLIETDGALAGYIALCRGFSIEFNGFDAFVDEFFLLPEFRGQGIGGQVLAQIAGVARGLDINALHLEVARDNQPAQALYRSAGFEARDKYLLMSLDIDQDPEDSK